MSTEAQIKANRANAQQSTGPKSEAGKTASSRNNFRHGFTGAFCVLGWESADEFNQLSRDLAEEHKPATPTETLLVTQMAQAWWLRTRALVLQNACFTDGSVDQKQLALYLRYQTTHERAFHKSLNQLLKLRAEKRKIEIGFESRQLKQSRAREQAEELARRQAVEKRKQELHNMKLETGEHQIPGRIQRIIAAENAA